MIKPGESGLYKDEEVVKVVVISGNGDLVVEYPDGALAVCKANELRIAADEAA